MPGTGCTSLRVAGALSENVPMARRMRGRSRATRARSFADRFTWRGATVRRCTLYCLSATSKSTAESLDAPSCTRSCAWPGACDRGMPTTASHLPCTRSTSTRCSPKVVRGARPSGASRVTRATPPGTSSCCGNSGAAGESRAAGKSGTAAPLVTRAPDSSASTTRRAARCSARRAPCANCVSPPGTLAFLIPGGDARPQAPAGEARLDLLAGQHRGGVGEQATADGARHDREAARQRRERADGVQCALRQSQAVLRARQAVLCGVIQPRLDTLVPRAIFPHDMVRRAAHQTRDAVRDAHLITVQAGARRPAEALREVIETLHLLLQPYARMGELQTPFGALEARAIRAQLAAHTRAQAQRGARQDLETRVAIRHHQLRGPRAGGGRRIGREVRDGEVDLVPDSRDHGQAARADGARDPFVVERPQILERAAAAREDQHLALGARRGGLQRRDQRRHGSRPLHRRRIDEDPCGRITPREDMQDVAQCGPGWRSDHADTLWKPRQTSLALERKQTFGCQLRFQALELAPQRADTRLLEVLDDDLVLPARLVPADAPAAQPLRAGAGREADERVLHPEHGAAQLRVPVLEREVPVAGRWLREVRQLPLHPQHTKPALEEHAHLAVQAGDAVHVPDRLGPGAIVRIYGHKAP